jgi:hypothetical protein
MYFFSTLVWGITKECIKNLIEDKEPKAALVEETTHPYSVAKTRKMLRIEGKYKQKHTHNTYTLIPYQNGKC